MKYRYGYTPKKRTIAPALGLAAIAAALFFSGFHALPPSHAKLCKEYGERYDLATVYAPTSDMCFATSGVTAHAVAFLELLDPAQK